MVGDTRAQGTERMGQEEFLIQAALAVSLVERFEDLDNRLRHIRGSSGVVLEGIDKAYEYEAMRSELEVTRKELKEQASQMYQRGMPAEIWIKLPGPPAKPSLKIRLCMDGAGRQPHLKVEQYR